MHTATMTETPVVSDRLAKNAMRNLSERIIEGLLFCAAAVSVLTTIGIVYVLVSESIHFFQNVSIVDFLTDTQWTPLFDDAHFGIMVLISGTLVSSAVALAVAIPMGTVIAIYLSEFANSRVREVAKPILELLGGIPTIVFGYFALLIVTPLLQRLIPRAAGILAALRRPRHGHHDRALRRLALRGRHARRADEPARRFLRHGCDAPAHGAARGRAGRLLRAGGLYILGISRAVGETMILAVAAGMQPNLTWNPMEPAATITSYIVQVALGDLPHGSIGYQTIFAAGLTLLLITLMFNILGQWLRPQVP